jgi:predicted AlkP superfamily phosphohydrolase/phosphomutase
MKKYSLFLILFCLFLWTVPVFSYVGPGAGFTLLSSLFTLVISFVLAFFSLLTLPFRILFLWVKRRKVYKKASIKKAVIVGFDGLDPDLCEKWLAEGKLPHFQKLKDTGAFRRFKTTYPSLSPVAWSTFSTGVNPGKHGIFDFLHRNVRSYMPELSSSRVAPPKKTLPIGRYKIPLGRSTVAFLRKSQSFWTILGKQGIFSHILRVPITFPPEKFNGALLSAMCTPDLRGSQGTFSFYSTREDRHESFTGGTRHLLVRKNGHWSGKLVGPENSLLKQPVPMTIPFELKIINDEEAELRIRNSRIILPVGEMTSWIPVTFNAGFGVRIHGICQYLLKSIHPETELYVSPIHLDPEKPALPISNPFFYAVSLSRFLGRYATLGLAEDTWALNEGVLDESAFLKQVGMIHEEREKQLFHVLKRTRQGVCACVFDATDRIQHMFFRYLADDHPSHRNRDHENYSDAIEKIYIQADDLVGRIQDQLEKDTLFIVISDHGFKLFRRGINLNAWLEQNGYLTVNPAVKDKTYLQSIDWSRTQAYAVGLAGIYINRKSRERNGIVTEDAAKALKKELIHKLSGLQDPLDGTRAIETLYDSCDLFTGPYAGEGPDLIVGFCPGYRISWEAAVGESAGEVFSDNIKFWSGDHGIDPVQVPGVFFCNREIKEQDPGIADIAPTILRLFGIDPPSYMDGRPLNICGFATVEG